MRKDLHMRRGKEIAQGSHASLGALLKMFEKRTYPDDRTKYEVLFDEGSVLDEWLNGIFTKVCVTVSSEEELLSLYHAVTEKAPQIPCALIEDRGLTEFHGEETKTCLGIGPWWSDEIDVFTKELKLY